jgi:hypothetical protein
MNIVIKANCTVTVMNVLYLPEICDWFDKIDIDHVRLNLLYSPSELSVLDLPVVVKNQVVSLLAESRFSNKVSNQIQSIINAINLSTSNNNTGKIVRKLKEVDQIRQEKFSDAHPEMAKLINYDV